MPSLPSLEQSPASDRAAPPLIAVVGPTASGKSDWALQIACRLGGEIVNIDSRQIYRRLDIGTAKPTAEMRSEIPHWCLDLIDPSETYSLGQYLAAAREAIADIHARGLRAVVAGGAGQHMRALLEGWQTPPVEPDLILRAEHERYASQHGAGALHRRLAQIDPVAAARIPANNVRRVSRALEVHELSGVPISEWQRRRQPVSFTAVAPAIEREALDERIAARTREMFAAGFVQEVKNLLGEGVPESAPGFDSIGYREVLNHICGEIDLATAIESVAQQTRRLARRQGAWFRRDDPKIHWDTSIPFALLE